MPKKHTTKSKEIETRSTVEHIKWLRANGFQSLANALEMAVRKTK